MGDQPAFPEKRLPSSALLTILELTDRANQLSQSDPDCTPAVTDRIAALIREMQVVAGQISREDDGAVRKAA